MYIRRLNPYVNFNGERSRAIVLYQRALGAKVETLLRYSKMPGNHPAPENKDRVIDCQLGLGSQNLMVSDVPAERPIPVGGNARVAIDIDDAAAGRRPFKLSHRAVGSPPLGRAFWGGQFGMLTDAFGMQWMVNGPA